MGCYAGFARSIEDALKIVFPENEEQYLYYYSFYGIIKLEINNIGG